MKQEHENNDLALRFLQGQLSPEETRAFLKRVRGDSGLRRALAEESRDESALLHAACTSDVLCLSTGPANEPGTAGALSDSEWRRIAREAVGRANARAQTERPALALTRERRLYALAAVIVLAVLGLGTIAIFRTALPAPSRPASVAEHAAEPRETHTAEQEHRLAAIPQDKKVYTKVSETTGFLAEQGSRARLYEKSDTTATVLVASGNLLFGVEADTHERFTIVTPHAVVTVPGAVLRVVVTELESEVTVYDGHADIVHQRQPGLQTSLSPGTTCVADRSSLIGSGLSNERLVEKRAKLFKDYLAFLCTEGESALRKRRS